MLNEKKAKVFFCLFFTAIASACVGQSCDQSVVPPGVVNGIDVTVTSSGSVSTYPGAFTSCTTTTPVNSVYLGQMGSFSYTMNFSQPVNNIVVYITATGSSNNENFIFTTSSGIPQINVLATCFSTVNGNEVLSGASSGTMGGGGEFVITAPSEYTSLTITGSGGENGALLSICSSSVIPVICLANGHTPALSAAALSTGCFSTTADLNTVTANNTPAGTVLSWHSTLPASDLNRLQNTTVPAGTYYASFYDALNDCYGTESDALIVTHPEGEISAGPDLEICLGQSVTLNGSDGSNFTWNNNVVNGLSFAPQTSGMYTVNGLDGNSCPDSDELFIIVHTLPDVGAGQDVKVCPGTEIILQGSGAFTYSWEKQIQNGIAFKPTESGNYYVIGTDMNGCKGSDGVNVEILAKPLAQFSAGPEEINELAPKVQLTDYSKGAISYNWSFGDATPYSTEQEPEHNYAGPGTFEIILVVANEGGCTDTTSQVIEIKPLPLYYVPNSFTPNGDEHNNVFNPVFNESFIPENYELLVYNRWGELLFESHDHFTGWDGTYDNQSAMTGVYTWVMGFRTADSGKFVRLNGSVNLIK